MTLPMEKEAFMKPTWKTYALFIVAMLSMAILDNVRGVFVPSFKSAYAISNTEIGMLLLFSSLFYMFSSYLSGHAVMRYNHQRVLRFGAIITFAGIGIIALSGQALVFYAGMLALNVGVAAIAICVNTTVPFLEVKHKAVLMNGIHFLYGVGATLTQKGTGVLLGMGFGFKLIYMGIGAIFILLALIAPWLPISHEDHRQKVKFKFTAKQMRFMGIFSVALGLYVAAELQTANWLVNYLKTDFGVAEASAANITAVFFLVFSLGRLVGGFFVQRIGYVRAIVISLSVACGIYALGLALGLKGAWLIAISGVFFSIAYPTAMLAVAEYFKEAVAQAAGIIITASAGVNMLMGLTIGFLADTVSIKVAMMTLPISLAVSVLLFLWVSIQGKHLHA